MNNKTTVTTLRNRLDRVPEILDVGSDRSKNRRKRTPAVISKELLSLVVVILLLVGCRKDKCISCLAISPGGLYMDQEIGCDKSNSFIDGFEDGFRARFRELGDTAQVTCETFSPR